MRPVPRGRAVGGLLLPTAMAISTVAASAQTASPIGPPPLGLEMYMPVPDDNPVTPARVDLGRRLFFDPVLSADRSLSCASCHLPDHAFADTVPRSVGVAGRLPARHTPSLLNAGYGKSFFWDGRTSSLEEQVVQPVENPDEMGLHLDEAVRRVARSADYAAAFRDAFGEPPSPRGLARALASYVRTVRSGNSPVDRFMAGDVSALDEAAREGYRVFLGRGGCASCHGGPLFSDGRFHNTGVGWGNGDPGRWTVTGRDEDRGAFKTPSLRDVSASAPYMHDGSLATLEEVVDFYDRGGGPNPHLDPDVRPLGLSPLEKERLVAFLRALRGATSPPAR